MENWTKIVVVLTIAIIIIILDVLLYNETEKIIGDTQGILKQLEISIENNDIEDARKNLKSLKKNWEKSEKEILFFIEHTEIDKVSLEFAVIEENVNNGEYKKAQENITEAKFLLKQIQNKYNLNFTNFF